MYSLAKMLTESPEKLERIAILFIKLVISLYLANYFFEFNITISEVIDNPIPKDISISKLMYYSSMVVLTWIIIWVIIADFVIGFCFIGALSKIGSDKSAFYEGLSFIGIIENNNEQMIPKSNIITFNEMLQEYSEEDERFIEHGKSRVNQYFFILILIMITFGCFVDFEVHNAVYWVGGIITVNLIISSVYITKIHRYFKNNLEELKKQFCQAAYIKMAENAVQQNPYIQRNYEIQMRGRRINLKRKTDNKFLKEHIVIYPIYHWNEKLTKLILDKGLQNKLMQMGSDEIISEKFEVVISNVLPDEKNLEQVSQRKDFEFLHCSDETEIYKCLEVLFFKMSDGNYLLLQ